jgi:HEAT repeat protein
MLQGETALVEADQNSKSNIINRAFFGDKDTSVYKAAEAVYLLVFRCVPTSKATESQAYIQSELASIAAQGPILAGDPLLSNLNASEIARVRNADTYALGLIDDKNNAYINCQNLLKSLSNPDPDLRRSALMAILSMVSF